MLNVVSDPVLQQLWIENDSTLVVKFANIHNSTLKHLHTLHEVSVQSSVAKGKYCIHPDFSKYLKELYAPFVFNQFNEGNERILKHLIDCSKNCIHRDAGNTFKQLANLYKLVIHGHSTSGFACNSVELTMKIDRYIEIQRHIQLKLVPNHQVVYLFALIKRALMAYAPGRYYVDVNGNICDRGIRCNSHSQ